MEECKAIGDKRTGTTELLEITKDNLIHVSREIQSANSLLLLLATWAMRLPRQLSESEIDSM